MAEKPDIYLSGKSTIDDNGELKYSGSVTRMQNKLTELGANVILIDHRNDKPADIKNADAVVFMGNDGDIDPNQYGAEKNPKTKSELSLETYKGNVDNFKIGVARAMFENEAMKIAIDEECPMFGVCGGLQRLNVIMGGDLKQHVDGQVQNVDDPATVDIDESDVTIPIEKINIVQDSKLAEILKPNDNLLSPLEMSEDGVAESSAQILANSYHHQVVGDLADGLKVAAISEYGTVEAIESSNPDHYMMAVQWHPEFLQDNPVTNKILKDFVSEAQENSVEKAQEKTTPVEELNGGVRQNPFELKNEAVEPQKSGGIGF